MARALIAGGGIAGMAAALALARAGWEVELFEQAPALGEVGAGLQLGPNATRVLRWLGVLDAVAPRAVRPEAAELRDGESGRLLFRLPLGAAAEARWGAPYLVAHRADLHSALRGAVQAAGARVVLGRRVTGYAARPEGAALHFEADAARSGALVIGADGIRSALREQLNGPEVPVFSGRVAWRGLVPAAALPSGAAPVVTVWAGPGRHVVTYPVRRGELVNFVAVEERAEWTAEGWSVPGEPARLRAAFAGWSEPVTTLLGAVRETFVWGLFQREAQIRWVNGCVALIGDAAHPMLPFLAQGAAMALEDVAVLAGQVAQAREAPEETRPGALAASLLGYERLRWPRVRRVVERSEENGRLFHRRAGPLATAALSLGGRLSAAQPGLAARAFDWLYGYDAVAAGGSAGTGGARGR